MKSIHTPADGWQLYCPPERRGSMENEINKIYKQIVMENR